MMSLSHHFILGLLVLSSFVGVDGFNGYYQHFVDQCRFSSWDLTDLEYISSYVFNKAEYIRFNSTVGKFVGFTANGVRIAEEWNNDAAYLRQMQADKNRFCRPSVQKEISHILTKTVEPEMRLRLTKASRDGHPAVLMCSAYDFYPKMIKLTWYRDGQEITTSNVISSEELADGDWYYQMHSHLEFTPKAEEKISCMMEHPSLKKPRELVWDSSMPEPERRKIAIGVAGLVLGLIVTAAGFIYYRTKARGLL